MKSPDVVLSNNNAQKRTDDITNQSPKTTRKPYETLEKQTHFLILHTAMCAFSSMQRQQNHEM